MSPNSPPALHDLDVSVLQHTWFEQVIISVLEQGDIYNMQARGG